MLWHSDSFHGSNKRNTETKGQRLGRVIDLRFEGYKREEESVGAAERSATSYRCTSTLITYINNVPGVLQVQEYFHAFVCICARNYQATTRQWFRISGS